MHDHEVFGARLVTADGSRIAVAGLCRAELLAECEKKIPGLCTLEFNTADPTEIDIILADRLTELGIEHRPIARTGVLAWIEGRGKADPKRRAVVLRADIDALPITEQNDIGWRSCTPGVMHACGHDGHVGTLLAAVHYINQHRDFAGRLVAIFQPGEEGFAGGRYMIEDGLVQKFGIDEFYALHAEPMLPVGCVGFIPGFATANADIFKITFTGVGGHGSRPHLTRDPLVAACECVLSLQTIVSRSVDPNQTAVVSAGCISCGNEKGSSVVQKTATIVGTTRSFEKEVQDIIIQRMQQIVDGTALSNDMKGKLEYTKLYPAMFNSPEHVEKAKALLEEALGLDKVKLMIRRAGGEDFSFMLQAKPGCLFRLGVQDETHNASVHNPEFDFNDKAIATGAACLLTIALNRAAS